MITLHHRISISILLAATAGAAAAYGAGDAPAQNTSAASRGITLDLTAEGAVTATGGGHYDPLPIITDGGTRTFLAVPKGSRVQAYIDGQPGSLVNAIPVKQVQPMGKAAGAGTSGSPQFSADQKRVAYVVGLDSGKQAVVVDATQSPEYASDAPIQLFFAPVGHHFAYVVGAQNGSNSFVVDDGKVGLIYQGIASEAFSPDGKHFAYVGTTPSKAPTPLEVQAGKKQPQNECVVLDGVEQQHFAKIEPPLFSHDGQHIAYLAGIDQLNGHTRAVVDNREGPAYAGVRDLVLSDDGSRFAYVATKVFPKKETRAGITSDQSYRYDVVVDNGKEDPADDTGPNQIQHLCMSRDGRRIAYVAVIFPQPVGASHVTIVDNGKPSQQYGSCLSQHISPDGKNLVSIVSGAQGAIVLVNGQEFGPFVSTLSEPVFSEEGGHWACCISTGEQKFAILEDGKTIALTGIAPGTLSFQPGTDQLMMKTTTANNSMPVTFEVKGDAIAAADVPAAIAYSPNHQHMARVFTTGYGTSEAKQKIAIDGQAPSDAKYAGVQSLAVSDDGKHVAYIGAYPGENGKSLTHAIYDGIEGPGYWGIKDLALSPDGKHVAYVAQKSNGHGIDTYAVIDGVEGPVFQDVLIDGPLTGQGISANNDFRQVRFAADGSLHFFPVMNGQLYRAWYPADSFNGLPSLAAHEDAAPGPRDVHNFVRPGMASDPATAMHFVLAPGEMIYGVSEADGKFKKGTLFKVKTDGSGFTVLHDFYGGDDDGEKPMSLMLAPDGSIIGTLERKVFHYDPKAQQYDLLAVDTKGNPGPSLLEGVAADGAIIGFGGVYGTETSAVIGMAPDGSSFTRLENGQFGKPLLQYAQIVAGKDGNFFAISTAQGKASVVKFKSLKDTPTVVHKFAASPTDGNRPDANLVLDGKGNLYGSTSAGGMSQNGVIYKIRADGSNYSVVYNPDTFAFSRVFVPGDDGMLYGISKDGLLQLNPDGSGKPPVTLVAFDGTAYTAFRGATPNILFHGGAVYGLHNKAIYKVTLPKGGGEDLAALTVSIQTVPPQPLSTEAVSFTDPKGAATAGPAAGPDAVDPAAGIPGAAPQAGVPGATPGYTGPQGNPQQPQQPPPQARGPNNNSNNVQNQINRANNAANQLRGIFGR